MFQQTSQGIFILVHVIPKASRSELVEWKGKELKIRLAAVPEKGKANDELIRFLANFFSIGKSKVVLLKGETSRHKKVSLLGMSLEQIEKKIQEHFNP